jgi:UDP-N-acetyl-D-glucosamine/UDP-N-acetyl-D-galactosamine dehydrogenase
MNFQQAAAVSRAATIRLVSDLPVLPDPASASVAVIGLGYVGLPLLAGFAKAGQAIGFDIDERKLKALRHGEDTTGQVSGADLAHENIEFTSAASALKNADVVVVCVPTPVNHANRPDYGPLIAASRSIGQNLKRGAVVIFESTVDPGTTEDRCLPVMVEASGMIEGVDFHIAYSPERVSPGEHTRRVTDIKKIISARSDHVLDFMEELYTRIVKVGLFRASSIRVAEAAKILENTQRDVNIALVNEMMQLFDAQDIRVSEVLAAAGSKWNFHAYFPGLVGGHCISVDPFYLLNAGRSVGLSMEVVAAARATNERTAYFLADKVTEMLASDRKNLRGAKVLVLGRAFKDNCPDIRNSKAFSLMDTLWNRGADVFSFDPIAEDDHFEGGRGAVILDDIEAGGPYDAVIVTAAHDVFKEQLDLASLEAIAKRGAPLVDLRRLYDVEGSGDHFQYWAP